jgi:hypothetical protein
MRWDDEELLWYWYENKHLWLAFLHISTQKAPAVAGPSPSTFYATLDLSVPKHEILSPAPLPQHKITAVWVVAGLFGSVLVTICTTVAV